MALAIAGPSFFSPCLGTAAAFSSAWGADADADDDLFADELFALGTSQGMRYAMKLSRLMCAVGCGGMKKKAAQKR